MKGKNWHNEETERGMVQKTTMGKQNRLARTKGEKLER